MLVSSWKNSISLFIDLDKSSFFIKSFFSSDFIFFLDKDEGFFESKAFLDRGLVDSFFLSLFFLILGFFWSFCLETILVFLTSFILEISFTLGLLVSFDFVDFFVEVLFVSFTLFSLSVIDSLLFFKDFDLTEVDFEGFFTAIAS